MTRMTIAAWTVMGLLASVQAGWGVVESAPTVLRRPLRVEVYEGAAAVRLRIRLPADVDPGSVEVLLARSELTIYASDTSSGRRAYERHVTLNGPVAETGVTAETEGNNWLRVVLPRPTSPRAMTHH